jgi:hypothetical protein
VAGEAAECAALRSLLYRFFLAVTVQDVQTVFGGGANANANVNANTNANVNTNTNVNANDNANANV